MYVHLIDGELCRVNISKLLRENIRPQFELVHKVEDDRGRGWMSLPGIHLFKNSLTNTILQLQLPSSRRRPRSYCSWDVVTTIDTKLYVLGNSLEFQAFQVFDPFHGFWKNLPHPPFSHLPSHLIPYGHFEWGHILAVFRKQRQDQAYVFDTNEEKWMPAVGLPHLACAVEFSGFLIGMLERSPQCLVAYKLDDENGLPDCKSQHTIHDLWQIFYPPLQRRQGPGGRSTFLTRFGDDRVLFLSTAETNKFVIVAVFRVSITTISGIPAVGAVFEHKQLYNLGNQRRTFTYSTFLMKNAPSYDHLDSLPPISLEGQPLDDDDDDDGYGHDHNPDDHAVLGPPPPAMLMADVEWDDGIKDKSLYLCFMENRTDSSVSYIIKAMKFRDLISTSSSSHYGLLRQVASTSGCHLAGLPSCGVLGSQILFASGRQDGLRKWLESELPNSMDIHVFDVKSDDPMNYDNIKPFTKFFKGMKPEPVLVELQGKLYALAGFPTPKYLNSGPFFEVFDPGENEWSPLPDPPPYTLYAPLPDIELSYDNYSYAIAGTNILVWGGNSPGVFRFDVAADPINRDWRLIENSCVGFNGHTSTLAVDSNGNGSSDFILFTHTNRGGFNESTSLGVYLMSREFDSIVCLPPLELPVSVSSFLRAQGRCYNSSSSFVHLGGRRVCLVLSSPFEGPYSRTVLQLGEVDKMSVFILVFEFQVTEKRESLAARILFHRLLEYDTNSCATRNSKTSDAHMVGIFLL